MAAIMRADDGDLKRMYNQSLLARRAMPEEVALEMYKRAVGELKNIIPGYIPMHRPNAAGFNDFLNELSQSLERLGMGIKRGHAEISGRGWVALVNIESDEVGQLATDLSTLEISYLREVIAAIVESYPANSIGSIAALQLTTELKGTMRRTDAEQHLGSLVSRGWFEKSDRGRYSLGTRALLELEHYLREQYDDEIRSCARCKRIIMTGQACASENCSAHYHAYCYKTIVNAGAGCMECRVRFDDVPPTHVGEKAIPRTQDDWSSVGRRRRRRANGDEEEEDDELEEEDLEREAVEDERPSQNPTPRGTPRRRAGLLSRSQSGQSVPTSRRHSRSQSHSQSQSQAFGETVVPNSIDEEETQTQAPQRRSRLHN